MEGCARSKNWLEGALHYGQTSVLQIGYLSFERPFHRTALTEHEVLVKMIESLIGRPSHHTRKPTLTHSSQSNVPISEILQYNGQGISTILYTTSPMLRIKLQFKRRCWPQNKCVRDKHCSSMTLPIKTMFFRRFRDNLDARWEIHKLFR